MTRREKIILAITGVAIAGAAIYYGLPSGAAIDSKLAGSASVEALLPVMQVQLNQTELTAREQRILHLVTSPWAADPFVDEAYPMGSGEAARTDDPVYMGFLQIGDKPLGWIDDREYEIGDFLEQGDFRVIQLSPTEAVIQATGSGETRNLKLDEEF